MLNLKGLQILFRYVTLCFLLYEMKQRNIPNRNREGLSLAQPWPLSDSTLLPTRVVASNLESNPGWGMGWDWSNQICYLWVPHLFCCLKSYSCEHHQLIASSLHLLSLFGSHFFAHCPLFFSCLLASLHALLSLPSLFVLFNPNTLIVWLLNRKLYTVLLYHVCHQRHVLEEINVLLLDISCH